MGPKLRVLLVDDDREDFLIAREALEQHRPGYYHLEWCPEFQRGLKSLLSGGCEAALVDYSLGSHTGLELLQTAMREGCDVPIIFLTALPNPDLDLEAVRCGAADFMLKSKLDPDRLDRSIRYAVERKKTQRVVADQQKQLSLTLKMAALGEMAGGIAHEIVNPLTIVQGRAQELKRLAEQGQASAAALLGIAEDVLNSTQRMTRIIRSLRNFTRTQESQSFMPVPVRGIFEDVARLCTKKFTDAGIGLEIVPPAEDATIACNVPEATQALFILLNNAFDAIEPLAERWARVEFQTDGEADEIWVTDSGNGIPSEHQNKIFMPFFTTKPAQKGTGLGLSIAQRIMDSHAGQLKIDQVCANTRFKLRFIKPRRDAVREGTRSVLVVEDDAINLNFVAEAFRRRGFEVHTATNGEEGLQVLRQRSVGAVVTDIRMPVCDGVRMFEQLREESQSLPPVFFMTGFYERSPASESLMSGATAVYDKPFDVSALVNHVLNELETPRPSST